MKRLDPATFSEKYAVRELTPADVPTVLRLCAELKNQGFGRVRLGIDKGNPQSTHFWRENGFQVIREVPQGDGIILLAERSL